MLPFVCLKDTFLARVHTNSSHLGPSRGPSAILTIVSAKDHVVRALLLGPTTSCGLPSSKTASFNPPTRRG